MQTRRKSRVCSQDKEELWQEFMEHIDKRFKEFKQKDLKSHHALLKNWKSTLAETKEWYSNSAEKFQSLVTSIMKRQPVPELESCENGVGGRDRFLWELAKSVTTAQQQQEHDLHESRLEDANSSEAALLDHSYCRPPGSCKIEFQPHQCGTNCFMDLQLKDLNISPLQMPLVLGWQRQVCKRQNSTDQQDAIYVTPCKRKLRSLDEVRQYLDLTCAKYLKGLHFTFDPHCSLLSVPFEPKDSIAYLDDLSSGIETTPVSCVNMFSHDLPKPFDYITKCTVEPSVRSATPTGFLVCCACTDNCMDRSKCACWQLTLEEARLVGNVQFSVGYVHHRLKRPQHSAVYECHSSCACNERCSNRVVQGGTRHRLQVFHTGSSQLGWAVRTLDDIPEGTFVCAYFGNIHAEVDADKIAKQHGDEYFADLDYMEVIDRHKANYEATLPLQHEEMLGEGLAPGVEYSYRFSDKKSARSMTSSSPLEVTSGTGTPRESTVTGRGSSNSMESLAAPSSANTSPLSSLSGVSSLSLDVSSEINSKLTEDHQATPLTPPTTASRSSSLPDDGPPMASAPQQSSSSPRNIVSSPSSQSYPLKLRSRSSFPNSPSVCPPVTKSSLSGSKSCVSKSSTDSVVPPPSFSLSGQSSSPRLSRRSTRLSLFAARSSSQATILPGKSAADSCDVSPQACTRDTPDVAGSNNKPRCLRNLSTMILRTKPSFGPSTVSSDLSPSPMRSLPSLRSGSPCRAQSTPPKRKRQSSPIPCPLYLALSPGHTPPSSPEPEDSSICPPQPLKKEPSFLSLKKESSFLSLQVKPEELEAPSTSPSTRGLNNSRTSATPPLRSSPRLRAKLHLLSREATNDPQSPLTKPVTKLLTSSKETHRPPTQDSTDIPPSQADPSTSDDTSATAARTQPHSLSPAGPSTGVEATNGSLSVNEKSEVADRVFQNRDGQHHKFRTRRFFHEDCVYFMDAKDKGNVGRFLNHSCSPNLFVQNVFVDNHDLRFPWVAFFAARRISAMEELTWDYNYEVGSVEDKVIQCLCGTHNCRKRLL